MLLFHWSPNLNPGNTSQNQNNTRQFLKDVLYHGCPIDPSANLLTANYTYRLQTNSLLDLKQNAAVGAGYSRLMGQDEVGILARFKQPSAASILSPVETVLG